MNRKLFIVFLALAWSCKPNIKVPEPSAGNADFSKFVALGGDFVAGYQDGALYQDGQIAGSVSTSRESLS